MPKLNPDVFFKSLVHVDLETEVGDFLVSDGLGVLGEAFKDLLILIVKGLFHHNIQFILSFHLLFDLNLIARILVKALHAKCVLTAKWLVIEVDTFKLAEGVLGLLHYGSVLDPEIGISVEGSQNDAELLQIVSVSFTYRKRIQSCLIFLNY